MNDTFKPISLMNFISNNDGTLDENMSKDQKIKADNGKTKKTLPTIPYKDCIEFAKSKKILPTISYKDCVTYEKSKKTLPTNIND